MLPRSDVLKAIWNDGYRRQPGYMEHMLQTSSQQHLLTLYMQQKNKLERDGIGWQPCIFLSRKKISTNGITLAKIFKVFFFGLNFYIASVVRMLPMFTFKLFRFYISRFWFLHTSMHSLKYSFSQQASPHLIKLGSKLVIICIESIYKNSLLYYYCKQNLK